MSLEDTHLCTTIEWRILSKLSRYDLARYCNFTHNAPQSRTIQDALADLDSELPEIFRAIQLETLLETKDEALDEVAYYGSSNVTDGDDSFLQPPTRRLGITYSRRVYNILKEFCSFLEERVNPALIVPKDGDDNGAYQKLQLFLDRIEKMDSSTKNPNSTPDFDFQSTPFLSVISKSRAMKPTSTSESHTNEVLEQQMLQEIKDLRATLLRLDTLYNEIRVPRKIDKISIHYGLHNGLNEGMTDSVSSFNILRKYQQRTATARRVICDSFNKCSQEEKGRQHEAFFQLPSWEMMSDYYSPQEELPQLFFIRCSETRSEGSDWCHTRMYPFPTDGTNQCRRRPLCLAMRSATSSKSDLDVYAPAHPESNGSDNVTIHTPIQLRHSRRYDKSIPGGGSSLRDLAKIGYFFWTENMDFAERTGGEDKILDIGQRTALAKRLVVSLMLSVHSDRTIDVWCPKYIRFLHPRDTELTPMIPVYESRGSQISWGSKLPKILDQLRLEDGDYDQTLPISFYDLAKSLVLIADGSLLERHEIRNASKYNESCVELRKLIRARIQGIQNTSRENNAPDILPFLNAANNCLYFHERYPTYLDEEPSGDEKEAAFRFVFEQVLTVVDERLRLENQVQPSPVIPTVALFDGTTCLTVKNFETERFMAFLESFPESYSRLLPSHADIATRRVRIALIDTGVDFAHPGIMNAKCKGRMKEDWCLRFSDGKVDKDIMDEVDSLHGSNCASLIHKAAPEADIYVAKVFKGTTLEIKEIAQISKAIDYAMKEWNVDIISMSFGLTPPDARQDGNTQLEESDLKEYEEIINGIIKSINNAITSSRLVFAAASNDGKNRRRTFPANYPSVFGVYASDGLGAVSRMNPSSQEDDINIMTLGIDVKVFERRQVDKNGVSSFIREPKHRSGTSFATAIAAGIAGTVLDIADRGKEMEEQTRKRLRNYGGMRRVFTELLPRDEDNHCYLTPWHLLGRS
ncbi:uncharacterized protein TrAtP1_010421 [Trichoderma atroviride]|uniref:uncharacterized protein n=1 Tax=Hypocrea atroviridis TaxID=63577 RepID=UPI00332C39B2|nr:hypothetical protein TrAtP1_010421 [Trichoderma atroviride]